MASEMHPLIEKKFARIFEFFDFDGDGVITRADYVTMAGRWADAAHIPHGSPPHQMLVESMLLVWQRLCAVLDLADDGEISRAKFLWAEHQREDFHRNLKPEEYHDTQAIFFLMDTAGRGYIEGDAFARAFGAFGMTPAECEASFAVLDTDGDGRIDLPQLTARWAEFFTSTDPEAPGNWLFGPLDGEATPGAGA